MWILTGASVATPARSLARMRMTCRRASDALRSTRIDVAEFNRFYIPIFALDKSGVEACTLCPKLLAEGRRPACVNNCLTNALHFDDADKMDEKAKTMVGDKIVVPSKKANVVYISRKPMDKKLITG